MRGRRHDQSGNILVIFAILLPLFMVTGMVVIDVGYWWANARKAQIAADACALAAAKELPLDDGPFEPASDLGWVSPDDDCVYAGRDYVLTNLPDQSGSSSEPLHSGTAVLWPYEGDPTLVEATVHMKVRTFFGRFVGLGGVELERRAVAEQSLGQGDYAIYAHSSDCGEGLRFNSLSTDIDGRVHSNGEFKVNGSGFRADEGTRGTCLSDTGSARFGPPPGIDSDPVNVGQQTWPAWWTPDQFGWVHNLEATDTCDVMGQTILFKDQGSGTQIEVKDFAGNTQIINISTTNVIPTPRTYCAWEKVTLARPNMRGTLTVLSPEIEVNAIGQDLTAHEHGVLFFIVPNNSATSDGSISTPGGGVPSICQPPPANAKLNTINNGPLHFRGVIFAPCTQVKIDAAHTTITDGAIFAYKVLVNDEHFRMEGDSGIGATITLSLDQ